LQVEAALRSSDMDHTILRCALFYENNWLHRDSVVGQGRLDTPTNANCRTPSVCIEDIAEAAAQVGSVAATLHHH
jgi:uncharacterized protein YbjT (DUF2867 family)